MEELLLSLLLMMNRFEGIRDAPSEVPSSWSSRNTWQQTSSGLVFEAESRTLSDQCKKNPDGYIEFPVVLYGAHEVLLDDTKRIQFGNPTMDKANFVVSAPVLECHSILNVDRIQWRASAYSKYFARISHYPRFTNEKPLTRLFGENLYIGSAIGLVILAIFAMSVLYGKESNRLMVAICSAIISMAVYQLSLIAPAFEIELSMLNVHRIGDIGLVLGIFFVIMSFWIEHLIPMGLFRAHAWATALSLPFLLAGTNGNSIQFGTSVPMLTVVLSFGVAAYRLSRQFWSTRSLEAGFTFLFSTIFVYVVANDIFVFTGSSSGYTFMSVGVLLAFLILLLAVNQRLSATYRERDYLRGNLEQEVERKTAELQSKTAELEHAMKDLRHTQAELIHSAKLASLGTLSAGIAHEINNSVNFVSGAIVPLEKMIAKLEPVSPRDYEMGRKLLHSIKDGINITVEIVKSLRQFTGLNQAKLKDIQLIEVVRSVTTILRPKLKDDYQVLVDVPEELTMYGDVVGINQILMNLITNAIDAMPKGGSIQISARSEGPSTIIEVKDTGTGIPDEIKARIFDPFFTTKEVGSGTGLGLYIINKEIDRHQGRIEVESQSGIGTTFRLTFPKQGSVEMKVPA